LDENVVVIRDISAAASVDCFFLAFIGGYTQRRALCVI